MADFVMEGTGTVCILSGRTYTKVNSGFAVVGIYNNQGQYTGPLIVSKTAAAVTYSATSGGPWTYATTITHGGETWYVNTTEHFYGGNPEDTSGLDRYKCSATTPATAAEELLTAYEATLPYYPAAGQIADYTGTEFHQIGKLYEFGGSAFSPIARVYDWNGTAASLIYSDETVLYNGGMVVNFEPRTYVSNSTYVYAYADNNGDNLGGRVNYNVSGGEFYTAEASWRTADLIDLSQYSSITVAAEVYTRVNSYNGVRLEFWDEAGNSVGTISIQENQQGVTTNSEWTFSLADYNSPVKVGITAWQTYSEARGAEFHLFSLSLS